MRPWVVVSRIVHITLVSTQFREKSSGNRTAERRSSFGSRFRSAILTGQEGIQTGWVDMISLGDIESLSQALGVAWRGKGHRYAPGRATASGEEAGLGAIF
jgi:hypothetical protein